MARLLGSRAWSVLALVAGIASVWAGEAIGLRLACAAGLAIGIAQQLTLLALSIRMLGTFCVRLSAAIMLCAGVAGWHLANSPSLPFLVVAGLLVVLAGLWWFCTALKDADVVQLKARNLPGAPEKPVDPPRLPYGWAGVVICGFLVLGFVAATLPLSGAAFAMLAVLAVAMLAVIRVQLARFTRYNKKVLDKLRAYRPVLTMPYNGHAEFHIGLWSPYLERTGQPFTVVTTDALSFQRVADSYTMPVIYAPRGDRRAIRAMLPKTIRAAVYVYSGNNADFLKARRRLTHIWLHHGDSDKEASFRRKAAAYDVLVVAGQAAIDRYATHGVCIPSEKFKILGRPQIENIETATASISSVDKPVVLYAPTWYAADREINHSSLPLGTEIVSALLARNATVIFRPHPARRKLRPAANCRRPPPRLAQFTSSSEPTPRRRPGPIVGIRPHPTRRLLSWQMLRTPWWRMSRGSSPTSCSRLSRSRWLRRATRQISSEPDSLPAALPTSSNGTFRRSTMRLTPCWVTIRSQPPGSNVARTTSEAMKAENRLAPLSSTCNR